MKWARTADGHHLICSHDPLQHHKIHTAVGKERAGERRKEKGERRKRIYLSTTTKLFFSKIERAGKPTTTTTTTTATAAAATKNQKLTGRTNCSSSLLVDLNFLEDALRSWC